MHDQNSFLTLTYDSKHLPSDGSLDVEHWKLFAKRLRKKMGKFRYFHCGEYGEATYRPHYHAALFGLDFHNDRRFKKTTESGNTLYTSPILTEVWGKGHAWIGSLTFQSAAYVARYIMKKQTGPDAHLHYTNVDENGDFNLIEPEYCTMSRKPGLGKTWIDKYMTDVYPSDQVITNGKPSQPPKFYDQQYELINPEGMKEIRFNRARTALKHEENNTPDRLAVRESVNQARTSNLKRTL